MAATTDTSDAGKESGDAPTVEAPSKEQIDAVFASAIEAVDGEVENWINDHIISIIATQWYMVDQLRQEANLTVDSDRVEELREEHLDTEEGDQ